ncbi:MAG: DUF2927 domain-containing protein [Ruminococcaceae bacterium]|nr:DUF2927 domain-containing protein [Oscillospiraceae bacterium]
MKRFLMAAFCFCLLVFSALSVLPIAEATSDTVSFADGHEKIIVLVDSSLYPESAHEYGNYVNQTKTFTYPGAVSLKITFSASTKVESNYDYLYLYDGNGTQIGKYTGTAAADLTLTIPGDTFQIKLTSDGRTTAYGYSFSSIWADTGEIYHPPITIPGTATCTTGGLSEGSYCEICGMVLQEQVMVAPLGHLWTGESCTATAVCDRCGAIGTDAVILHKYEDHFCTMCDQSDLLSADLLQYELVNGYAIITGYDGKAIGTLMIPQTLGGNTVVGIGENAFSGCAGLTEISLPSTISSIESGAFSGCDSISVVNFYGTVAAWEEMEIGSDNDALQNALWHYLTQLSIQNGVYYYHCVACGEQVKAFLLQLEIVKVPDELCCSVDGVVDLEGIHLRGSLAGGEPVEFTKADIESAFADLSAPGKTQVKVRILGRDAAFTAYVHEGGKITLDRSLYPESTHDYGNYLDETKTFTYPGAQSLIITFSPSTKVENYYDYLYLYDGEGKQIGKYTDTGAAGKTITVSGDTFRIRITSDLAKTAYGYSFTSIVADMGEMRHPPVTVPGTAPTCTQTGISDGSACRICNLTLVEQTEVPALGHSYINGLCARCGALGNDCVILTKDTQFDVSLKQDLYIDLNGFDLTGTIRTNGYRVYGMDSSTDGYTCDKMGIFSCLDENGKAVVPVRQFKSDRYTTAKRYMAVETSEGFTFHRFYLSITKVSLRTGKTGFGYKGVFYGDEMVLEQIESAGFTLNLQGKDTCITRSLDGRDLEMGREYSLSLNHFDILQYGTIPVNASVFIKLRDNTVVQTGAVSHSMQSMLQLICQRIADFNKAQINAIQEMLSPMEAVVTGWGIDAILNWTEHSALYIPGVSVDDVIRWYNEVVLDAEFSSGGNASLVQKWAQPICYSIAGSPTQEDLALFSAFCDKLNQIPGFPGIRESAGIYETNLDIFFCPGSDFKSILGSNFVGMDGGVTFWYDDMNRIYDATICVRSDIAQYIRNSVLQEEIYNGLGPVQDTWLREDSLIYAGYSTPQEPTKVDWLLLKLLYHPDIQCGMNAAQCEAVIRSLYY